MTESAHAHICRYIRSEFEGGRIGAVAAAMALHELGLPDSDPHAIQMRIEARWQTGSHAEALEISGQAFARWPKRTWYHYALCRSALLNGMPEDADRIATDALAGEPLLPPVSTGMAEILVLLGRCGEASGLLQLGRGGADSEAPLPIQVQKQRRADLIRLISVIFRERRWPLLVPLLASMRHEVLISGENFKMLVNSLKSEIGSHTDEFLASIWPAGAAMDGAAAAVIGAVCQKLGFRPQALHYIEAARQELGPSLPFLAFHDWCRLKFRAHEFADVITETAARVKDDPANVTLAALRAEALYQNGEDFLAIETLGAAVAASGEDVNSARRQLAGLLLKTGRPEEALATLNAVVAAPQDLTAKFDCALAVLDALMAQGELPKAEAAAAVGAKLGAACRADISRQEQLIDRQTRLLMLLGRVAEAVAVVPDHTANVDLLRKKVIGSIVIADLDGLAQAEQALSRVLAANWRPSQSTPGYNQHLLFARNTRLNPSFKALCAVVKTSDDAGSLSLLRLYLQACPFDYSADIQLVYRMSRLGLLSQPAADNAMVIPKRIMFFWDRADRPPAVDRLIETWRTIHPSYAIEVLDLAAATAFLNRHFGARHARALGRAQNNAMKADFFRLCYLYHSGGIYADCDDRCRAPLDEWLAGRDAVLYQENHMSFAVANNFMAVIPGQPYLGQAIEQALISLEAPVRSFTFSVTGPGLLTNCFAQWLIKADEHALARVRLLRAFEYYRNISPHMHVPYKNTALHWVKQEGAGA